LALACDLMSEEAHEAKQVYHIDANALLSFLWEEEKEEHRIIRKLFNKNNPGDLKIKINTFALGEVLQNLIRKHEKKPNYEKKSNEIRELYGLFHDEKLEIFKFENIDNKEKEEHDTESEGYDKGLQELTKRINKLREADSLVDNGDIVNIAVFSFDTEGTDFKTFDKDMIKSQGIKKYLNDFNKKVSGIE